MYSGEVSRCGDDTVRTLNVIATTEKEDIRVLNDRLGDLFLRLERARRENGKQDNTLFLAAIASLQDEIKKLKGAYESELNTLRRDYEKVCQEKSDISVHVDRYKKIAEQMQSQFNDCTLENTKLRDDLNNLRAYVEQKEHEIARLTSCLHNHQTELELLKPKALKYEELSETYRIQLEQERRLRLDAEAKYQQLLDKYNFDGRMHEQHIRDLNERLEKQNTIIEDLNEKLRNAVNSEHSHNPALVLNKIREKLAHEIQQYKADTEEAVRKTIADMREKLERSNSERDMAIAERDRMRDIISKLQGQINELEGQLQAALQSNQQLQVVIQNMKMSHARSIRDLEKKLAECQECVMEKIREVAQVREVQASLRAEIESYKALLEYEELKLTNPSTLPPLHMGGGGGSMTNSAFRTFGYPTKAGCPNAGGGDCVTTTHTSKISSGGSHLMGSKAGLMCPTHASTSRITSTHIKSSGLNNI